MDSILNVTGSDKVWWGSLYGGPLVRLTTLVNLGRWAVRGLAIFPEGHGLEVDSQQFVTIGKRAAFAALNDKEVYWFLVGQSSKG